MKKWKRKFDSKHFLIVCQKSMVIKFKKRNSHVFSEFSFSKIKINNEVFSSVNFRVDSFKKVRLRKNQPVITFDDSI